MIKYKYKSGGKSSTVRTYLTTLFDNIQGEVWNPYQKGKYGSETNSKGRQNHSNVYIDHTFIERKPKMQN